MLKKLALTISKFLLVSAAVILALFLLLIAALHVDTVREEIFTRAIRLVAKDTQWRVEAAQIEETAPFQWTIQGLSLQNSDGKQLHIDSLNLQFHPNKLLLGRIVFSDVHIQGFRIEGQPPLTYSGNLVLVPLKKVVKLHGELSESSHLYQPTQVSLIARKRQQLHLELHLLEEHYGLVHRQLHLPDTIPFALHTTVTTSYPEHEGEGDMSLEILRTPEQWQSLIGKSLRLQSDFSWTEESLRVMALELFSPVLIAKGRGTVTGEGHVDVHVISQLKELTTLEHWIDFPIIGSAEVEARLWGPLDSLNFNIDVGAESLLLAHQVLDNAALQAHGLWTEDGVRAATTLWIEIEDLVASTAADISWKSAGTLLVDNLHFHVPHGTVRGALTYQPQTSLLQGTLKGEIPDLSVFSSLINQTLEGQASLTATIDQTLNLSGQVTGLKIGHMSAETVSLTLSNSPIINPELGTMTLSATNVSSGNLIFEQFAAQTESIRSSRDRTFSLTAKGDWQGPLNLSVDGLLKQQEGDTVITISQFFGDFEGERLATRVAPIITLGNHMLTISPFHIEVGHGSLKGQGRYKDDEVVASLTLHQIPVKILSPLLVPSSAQGVVSGEAKMSGHISAPEMDLQLSGEGLTLPTGPLKVLPPLKAKGSARLRQQALQVTGELYGVGHQPLQLTASVPVKFSLHPTPIAQLDTQGNLNMNVKASGEISPILELFFPGVTHVTGNALVAVDIRGSIEAPRIGGTLDFSDCTFESLETGCVFKNIKAQFEGVGDKLVVKQFVAKDGEAGTVTGTGALQLDSKEGIAYDFVLNLDNTVILRRELIKALGSGDLHWSGRGTSASLSGELTAEALQVQIPSDPTPNVSSVNVTFINTPEGKAKPIRKRKSDDPLRFDIKIDIPTNCHINSADMWSDWTGEIAIQGNANEPEVHGQMNLQRGEVKVNGKPFLLQKGKILFAGNIEKETSLDVLASQDIDGGTIEALVRGSLRTPSLSFRSNPPMTQREILSWLLFSRGLTEANAFETQELNQLALSLPSLKKQKPGVLSRIKSLGIDRIDVDADPASDQGDLSINIGKYLSKGLYISLRKAITSETNRVCLEADVIRNVKLQAEVADDSAGKMLLMWKHDY